MAVTTHRLHLDSTFPSLPSHCGGQVHWAAIEAGLSAVHRNTTPRRSKWHGMVWYKDETRLRDAHVTNKELSCRRETARFFVSLSVLLSRSSQDNSRSLEMTFLRRVSPSVFHCDYVCISYRVWDIMSWPWNLGLGSFKVIESGAIGELGYGFLLAFCSNYGCIFNSLWDIQR